MKKRTFAASVAATAALAAGVDRSLDLVMRGGDPVRQDKGRDAAKHLYPQESASDNDLDRATDIAILEGRSPIKLTGINPDGETWEVNAFYDREANVLTVPQMEGLPEGHIFGRVNDVPIELKPTYDPENNRLILGLPEVQTEMRNERGATITQTRTLEPGQVVRFETTGIGNPPITEPSSE